MFELVHITGPCKTLCSSNQTSIFKKSKIPFLSKNKVCRSTEIETLWETSKPCICYIDSGAQKYSNALEVNANNQKYISLGLFW